MMHKNFFVITALLYAIGAQAHTRNIASFSEAAQGNAHLVQVAESVSQSLRELTAIEKTASGLLNHKSLPEPDSATMTERVSVDWSGPIQPLLQHIADKADYTLKVIGRAPALPVLVTLTASNMPLGYILRDANWQAAQKADVFVYPDVRMIELRYAEI